jgi:hypothetical protein
VADGEDDDDPLVGCADGEWEEDGNAEEDSFDFDEKTFVSAGGTILTQFRVNVSRRSVEDLDFAAAVLLEKAQGMYGVDGSDTSVPETVTFAFGRGAEVRVRVVVLGAIAISSVSRRFRCAFWKPALIS